MPKKKKKCKGVIFKKHDFPYFERKALFKNILKQIKHSTAKDVNLVTITKDILYKKLAKILADSLQEVKHVRIILKRKLRKPLDKYKIIQQQEVEEGEIGLEIEELKKQDKFFTVKHVRMLVKKELMKKTVILEEEEILEESMEDLRKEEMETKEEEGEEEIEEEQFGEEEKAIKPDDTKEKGELLFKVLDQMLLNKIQTKVSGRASVKKGCMMIKKRIIPPSTGQLLKMKELKQEQDQKFEKLITYLRQTINKMKDNQMSYEQLNNLLRLVIKLNLKHIFALDQLKDKKRLRHIKAVKFLKDRKATNQILEIEYFKRILSKLLQKMAKMKKSMHKLNERQEILSKSPSWVCDKGKYIDRNKKKWKIVKKLAKEIDIDTELMVNDVKRLMERYEPDFEEADIYRKKSKKSVRFKLPKRYNRFNWANSTHSHAKYIEKLRNEETNHLFGDKNVAVLIEHAYSCITVFYKDVIVGFIAVEDYPNIGCLQADNWNIWLRNHCGIRNFTKTNTLFIHFLVWNEQFEHNIMQPLLLPIFVNDGFIKNIVIIPPPFIKLFQNKMFKDYFKCVKSEINPHMHVYFTTRFTHVAEWDFKPVLENDCTSLNAVIEEYAPELVDFYGKHVVEQIMIAKAPHRKIFLVTENDLIEDTLGFISYSDQIDYNTLKDNFDICDYNGFRLPTEHDMRYDDGLFENIEKLDEPNEREILKTLTKKVICEMNLKDDDIDEIDYNKKPTLEQLCEFASIPDIHLTTEGIPEAEDVQYEINENKIMEYITLRNLCLLADPEGNRMLRKPPYRIEPNVQYSKGRKNAFSIEMMFPIHYKDKKLFLSYIVEGFKAFDHLDFIVISTPRGVYSNPILQYLNRLEPITISYPHEVFAGHKSVFFWDFYVRKASMDDLDEIISMTIYFDNFEIIQEELFSAMKNEHPQSGTVIILMAKERIVGLALVFQELDVEFLKYFYDIELFMNFDLHKAGEHGVVKYFILSELYKIRTRHYLRAIMRLMSFSSLYCYKFSIESKVFSSIVLGLEYWVPVRPRFIPDFWACSDDVSPFYKQDNEPFSLFYMNYKISAIPKEFFYDRIVIVGSGELGLSFLENIIFNHTVTSKSFYDITLVSMSGIPRKGILSDFVECMNSYSGRFNAHYIGKIPILSLVKYIHGVMVEIRRKEKLISVIDYADHTHKFIEYDYLFLFCGEQYADPRAELAITIPGCKAFYNDRATFENKFLDQPANLYMINSHEDTYKLLSNILLDAEETGNFHGKLLVYGRSVDAWSFISMLKMKPDSMMEIIVVQPQLKSDCMNCIQNEKIYEEAINSLKKSNIELYNEYNFKDWTVKNNNIEGACFESRSNIIIIPCSLFISFYPKIIYYKTFLALIDAGLAFNGKLAIHNNFRTSDHSIYAAGTFTMYYKRHARHYNHNYYNSTEIGAEVAKQFINHLTLLNDKRSSYIDENYLKSQNVITEFTEPHIQYGYFPTGWNYLNVSRPNSRLHSEISLRTLKDVSVLETGCFDTGPGYFRIVLDENHLVEDILCLTKNAIPEKNYIQLFGKPERLLNNLLMRYHANKIKDFYEYFNEGWAFAIYQDRFSALENKISDVLVAGQSPKPTDLRSCEVKTCVQKRPFSKKKELELNVTEVILLIMEHDNWEKISLDFQECLDILMNMMSGKRNNIEDLVIQFLDVNRNHLPMFINPTTVQELYQTEENSLILENPDIHLGVKPFFTEQPENINVGRQEIMLNDYVNQDLYVVLKKSQMREIINNILMKRLVRRFLRSRAKKIMNCRNVYK